jgi:hypothetical protein
MNINWNKVLIGHNLLSYERPAQIFANDPSRKQVVGHFHA